MHAHPELWPAIAPHGSDASCIWANMDIGLGSQQLVATIILQSSCVIPAEPYSQGYQNQTWFSFHACRTFPLSDYQPIVPT
jgi:hypothetical protein